MVDRAELSADATSGLGPRTQSAGQLLGPRAGVGWSCGGRL